jgi:hypothetical protein
MDSNPRSPVVDSIFSRPPRNLATTNRPGRQNRILTIAKGRFSRSGASVGSCLRRPRPDHRGVRTLNGSDRASSGLKGLDDILGGGFILGRLHLVEGKAGTCKATLGMQFVLAGRDRGEKGWVGSHLGAETHATKRQVSCEPDVVVADLVLHAPRIAPRHGDRTAGRARAERNCRANVGCGRQAVAVAKRLGGRSRPRLSRRVAPP